ncbi:hypothetical protein CISIN_1g035085mg [Citrus sinensis]|uniref:Uncharacterized protein n=1 Tax=Citrus sinensis TaxID=2711 RepID=A0A067D8V5_CITSI|nr:hypothetical protein CISIN_1g035085mg [Citrus sinensis]
MIPARSFTSSFFFAYVLRLRLHRKYLDLVGVNSTWLCSRFKLRIVHFPLSPKPAPNLALQPVFALKIDCRNRQ